MGCNSSLTPEDYCLIGRFSTQNNLEVFIVFINMSVAAIVDK